MKHHQHMTDQELVACYLNGCNEAFDCLLSRHQDKLYNYIFYAVHDADLANDLFQETFVKAITTLKMGRYTEAGRFCPWLTRIAHNLIIDHFRRDNDAQIIHNETQYDELLAQARLTTSSQEEEIVHDQTLKDVRNLMDHLPDNQREVIFMRFFQDLSFKEIAEQTGVSINTSLGRMRYALLNLRRMAREHHISLDLN